MDRQYRQRRVRRHLSALRIGAPWPRITPCTDIRAEVGATRYTARYAEPLRRLNIPEIEAVTLSTSRRTRS